MPSPRRLLSGTYPVTTKGTFVPINSDVYRKFPVLTSLIQLTLGPLQGRGFLFYTHRFAGFITYRFLKLAGVENANVGAYGFGRTDLNPIIIRINPKHRS